jgi:hypothetical protein
MIQSTKNFYSNLKSFHKRSKVSLNRYMKRFNETKWENLPQFIKNRIITQNSNLDK